MLPYIAEIADGVVIAVAPASATNPAPEPDDVTRIACGDNIRVGDLYADGVFSPPPAPMAEESA